VSGDDWQHGREVVILSGGTRSRFTYYADELAGRPSILAEYRETDRTVTIGDVYPFTPGRASGGLRDVSARVWEVKPRR
jgi:hypothetical protein